MWHGGHCSHQHADHGGDDAHDGPELGIQYTLYTKIDTDNVQCLNEAVEGSGKTVFKPWDERLDFSRRARTLFSRSGEWDEKFTLEVKKDIEKFWKVKVAQRTVCPSSDKMYILAMFPYPSGNLHMGHFRVYTIGDLLARYYSMLGKNVIYPIGWDSFGLPAENAAIERGEDPKEWTQKNIASMSRQLCDLNYSFNWEREISTCDPAYYRWTQYLFIKLFEAGLVYRKKAVVNWDPIDNTTLANEQVDSDGRSWRSGAKVEKRILNQWFVRTTRYSKELYQGLDDLKGWDDIVPMQKGWIGNVDEGTIFKFGLEGDLPLDELEIWTDRPELIVGAAFIIISEDHLLAETLKTNKIFAKNPFNNNRLIPVFPNENNFDIPPATGAFVGVPTASESETKFAEKNNIYFKDVLKGAQIVNSAEFNGTAVEARQKILHFARANNIGGFPASRFLKDWLISRQRYWGTPIPIVHCERCGPVPVPKLDLPLKLPHLPTGSNLPDAEHWIRTLCPKCGEAARRETDTMDTFVDSSWYFMRFLDTANETELVNPSVASTMMPVDLYIGGLEHAVMHLYYARFMAYFMYKELGFGNLNHGPEPFKRMIVQGMVVNETYRVTSTGEYVSKSLVDFSDPKRPKTFDTNLPICVEWEKMSKSKHNGVVPQDVTDKYGIDTTRLFILGDYGPTSRYKWPSPAFLGIKSWQDKLWMTVGNFRKSREVAQECVNAKHEQSCWQARNNFIKECTYHFEETHQFNLIIKHMQIFTKSLRSTLRSPTTFLGPEYERALGDLVVESDCDEELLFSVPFTGNVKLKGIIIVGGEGDFHPSALRLFKNRPNMSFDDAAAEPDQEFELSRDTEGTLEYPTKIVKFANVHHLTLHFPKSFGADISKVVYIGLKGEFTEAYRQEIAICNYELAPNPADHKVEQQCSNKNYESVHNNNNLGF
ncbi:putative leucine--tRNA ligase [Tropilaelaps mercedesae]|uniref:leucine--tRNA ligase n=1 Tax=Tropilaelaps mercedesae TaxID=418985 RepID=A0A1V9XA15_9ACAR|nr:putative leucine--tRNA ligase [Tropilaelaps mercedesae]